MGKAHCPRARLIMHLKNDDVLLYSLCSLGSKYKEIVAAIHARDTSISFEELHNKLLEHEVYLKREASQSEPSHITANATRTYSQTKPSNNRRNEKNHFPKIRDPHLSETNFSKAHPPILTHDPISNDPLQISTTQIPLFANIAGNVVIPHIHAIKYTLQHLCPTTPPLNNLLIPIGLLTLLPCIMSLPT